MTVKKQKYYVVWHGHKPGIYSSWSSCHAQVKNFPNAIYKSYGTKEEAQAAFTNGPDFKPRSALRSSAPVTSFSKNFIRESISVDAACSGNPGVMEYQGVWTEDGTVLFYQGPFREGTNNIGEFLALVHALALLQKKGDDKTPVYSDSRTAISWINRKKANTKLERNSKNAELFTLIHRGEKWLKEHQWNNPILKWETEKWGEIPADFGRK
jgi:ribonuclease HI